MGRELKRVAMDFDWPMNKTYEGFLNPYYKFCKNCPFCEGSGESAASKKFSDQWYGKEGPNRFHPEDNGSEPLTIDHPPVRAFSVRNTIQSDLCDFHGFDRGIELYWEMYKEGKTEAYLADRPYLESRVQREARRLISMWNEQWSHHLNQADVDALIKDGRLSDFTRNPLNEEQVAEKAAIEAHNDAEREKMKADDKYRAQWKTFNNGHKPTAREVNDWSIGSMGHDGINMWVCVKAKVRRLKLGTTKCAHCKGHGSVWLTPEYKKKADRWKEQEPTPGPGFQLWSNTGEGCPVSPVFETLDTLCEWCEDNATTFANFKASKEKWMSMLDADFVCHQEGNNIFL